jgi:hypothetical protein
MIEEAKEVDESSWGEDANPPAAEPDREDDDEIPDPNLEPEPAPLKQRAYAKTTKVNGGAELSLKDVGGQRRIEPKMSGSMRRRKRKKRKRIWLMRSMGVVVMNHSKAMTQLLTEHQRPSLTITNRSSMKLNTISYYRTIATIWKVTRKTTFCENCISTNLP